MTRRSAHKYAVLVAKFRRRFPDRPLNQCIPRAIPGLLMKILPEGSFERQRFYSLFSADLSSNDAVEFCCRCVSLETGLEPEDGRRYLEQAEYVQEELSRQGLREQSAWLDQLRSSVAREVPKAIGPKVDGPYPGSGTSDRLTVPRFPHAGNWTGLVLFVAIASACAYFGHWKIAIIPTAVGVASFLTPVNFRTFDRAQGTLILAFGNALFSPRQMMAYPLRDVAAVSLETRTDNEGEKDHIVKLVFTRGRSITLSHDRRDADRVAAFLGIEKTVTKN